MTSYHLMISHILVYHVKHVAIYVQQMRVNRYLILQRIKGIQPHTKKKIESEKWLFKKTLYDAIYLKF